MGMAFHETVNRYPSTWLYQGITSSNKMIDRAHEMVVSKRDSPMNCHTRVLRRAPSTLRNPTSFDRSTARTVLRLVKLIQAISNINMAIEIKMNTTVLSPCFTSSKAALVKYTSFKGCRESVKRKPYFFM